MMSPEHVPLDKDALEAAGLESEEKPPEPDLGFALLSDHEADVVVLGKKITVKAPSVGRWVKVIKSAQTGLADLVRARPEIGNLEKWENIEIAGDLGSMIELLGQVPPDAENLVFDSLAALLGLEADWLRDECDVVGLARLVRALLEVSHFDEIRPHLFAIGRLSGLDGRTARPSPSP